jgi:hypothetical protein
MTPRPIIAAAGCALLMTAAACSSQLPAAPSPVSPSVAAVSSGSEEPGSFATAAIAACSPDVTAPTITGASASPNTLWPPNHKMRHVSVNYTATDACGSTSCSLSVTSNEPVNSIGDGNTAPDWMVVNARQVQLRAERQGPRSGRIYTITISCTDQARNVARTTVRVSVPHDQRR